MDSHPFTFTVCAHDSDRIGDRQEIYAEKIFASEPNSGEIFIMCPKKSMKMRERSLTDQLVK